MPEWSVAQIIYILEAEGLVAPGILKRSTLERHIYRAGYGQKQMQMYKEARNSSSKRFCKPHRMMLIQGDIKYGPNFLLEKMVQRYRLICPLPLMTIPDICFPPGFMIIRKKLSLRIPSIKPYPDTEPLMPATLIMEVSTLQKQIRFSLARLESRFYRGDSKRQLQQEIEIIRGVQHKKVVCILEEAHLIEKETLEEFCFLLNYRFDSVSSMAVVLVGQTELWENKLKLQRYAAIRQRIDIYCILPHLDRSETEQYIASHMDYSGCAQEVFTTKALDEIHKASVGIPRMLNQICEKALTYAFQNQKRLIDDYMIKYVVVHEMLGTMAT